MATPLGTVFRISIESVVQLLMQYLAGGLAAYFGLISPSDVRSLGSVTNLLLIPCLFIASLGRGLSADVFFDGGWVLVVIGWASGLIYAAIGWVLRFAAKPDPEFERLFVVMLAIPNIVAIPMSLSESLCLNGAFDDEFISRTACVERARCFVQLYVALDAINTFVIAQSYLTGSSPATADHSNAVGAVDHSNAIGAVMGRSASTDGTTTAQVETRTTRANVPQPLLVCASLGRQAGMLFRKPPLVGMLLGLFVGLTEPIQREVFIDDGALSFIGQAVSALGSAAVPIVNLMVAFSLGHKLRSLSRWQDLLGSPSEGVSSRTLAVLTLGRMVIVPLLDGAALYSLFGVLPKSRLLRVILFIEMAPPTASIVVLLIHAGNKPALAQLFSFALVPQYLLAPLTLTAMLIISLRITE